MWKNCEAVFARLRPHMCRYPSEKPATTHRPSEPTTMHEATGVSFSLEPPLRAATLIDLVSASDLGTTRRLDEHSGPSKLFGMGERVGEGAGGAVGGDGAGGLVDGLGFAAAGGCAGGGVAATAALFIGVGGGA